MPLGALRPWQTLCQTSRCAEGVLSSCCCCCCCPAAAAARDGAWDAAASLWCTGCRPLCTTLPSPNPGTSPFFARPGPHQCCPSAGTPDSWSGYTPVSVWGEAAGSKECPHSTAQHGTAQHSMLCLQAPFQLQPNPAPPPSTAGFSQAYNAGGLRQELLQHIEGAGFGPDSAFKLYLTGGWQTPRWTLPHLLPADGHLGPSPANLLGSVLSGLPI